VWQVAKKKRMPLSWILAPLKLISYQEMEIYATLDKGTVALLGALMFQNCDVFIRGLFCCG